MGAHRTLLLATTLLAIAVPLAGARDRGPATLGPAIAVPGVGSAPVPSGPCRTALDQATRILARTVHGVVFWTRKGTYGCLFSARRGPVLLSKHTPAQSAQSALLAGRYAAIRILRGITNYDVNREWLGLFDLRAGERVHELWRLGLPTRAGDVVQDYVLTARGALAWIGVANQYSERLGDDLPVEVHRWMRGHDEVVDRATHKRTSQAIEPRALQLSPDQRVVRWDRDGVRRSARMR
jgi:hypothetical protein